MTVASDDAVSILHLGKVPSPTAIAVIGKVWSVSVAKGVGGSIGVAFINLCKIHTLSKRKNGIRGKTNRPIDQTLTPASSPPLTSAESSCENSSTDIGR